MDTSEMDKSLVLYAGDKESADNDDMIRRLKNRERQRRYRERKWHEANFKKALTADQPNPPLHDTEMLTEFRSNPVQVGVSLNLTSPEYLTRVHCRRDWKKDARRTHVHKKPEDGSIITNNSETATPGGLRAPISQPDFNTLDNNPSHRLISSKRRWKDEARNKKSLE